MIQWKRYLGRRLGPRDTVIAVACVVIIGGLGYLGYEVVTAKVLEMKVTAAMPKVCAGIRQQRAELVKAIEEYKAHFGVYPPDHVVSRTPLVVDPVKNPLLYELAGVIYNPTNKTFELPQLESADAKYVKEFFQCEGFKNSAEDAEKVKRFLAGDALPARQLHDDPDVFAVGFTMPYEGIASEVVWEFEVSSWRYVSSAPTNNPGRFDLWNEVKTKNWSVTIGNWKGVE